MFYRIQHIALHYLRTTYRSRTVLIFALIMPLLFTFVLGSVIGGNGVSEPARWATAVADADGSALSQALVARLQASPDLAVSLLPAEEAASRTEKGDFVAAVVIPAGFGATLQAGEQPALAYYANAEDIRPAQTVEMAVRAAASELAGLIRAADISVAVARRFELLAEQGAAATYFDDALARAQAQWAEAPPVSVRTEPVTRLEQADDIPGGFTQSSPGMLVTFALVSILNGAIVLIIEREQGTLRRLLVMPTNKATILGGKVLAIFLAGMIQAAILILAGQFLFGVNWGQSPLALALLLVGFVFATTSLGMLIAGVARTYAQANALSNVLMYSIAAMGGAWWPIEITPQWMQQAAQILPTYWAMQGFHDIITRGLGLRAVLPETGVLVAFGLLFLSIGIWRFRYE